MFTAICCWRQRRGSTMLAFYLPTMNLAISVPFIPRTPADVSGTSAEVGTERGPPYANLRALRKI
jgi:hypothetical protein